MEITKKGFTLKVDKDISYNPNPRDNDDNIGKMYCYHRRYRLGDQNKIDDPEKFNDWLQENKENIVCKLPLYLYDHSGICMSTTDFNDPWDSGKVGYIVCTKQDLEKRGYTDKSLDEIETKLKDEVQEYSDYLEGKHTYYYFSIKDEDYTVLDSCSGFKYENLKGMLKEMSEYVEEKYTYLFDALLKKENQNYL